MTDNNKDKCLHVYLNVRTNAPTFELHTYCVDCNEVLAKMSYEAVDRSYEDLAIRKNRPNN